MVILDALHWAFGWLDSCSFLSNWSWVLALVFLVVSGVYYGYNLMYIRENEDKKGTKRYRKAEIHCGLAHGVIFIDSVFWLLTLHFLFL